MKTSSLRIGTLMIYGMVAGLLAQGQQREPAAINQEAEESRRTEDLVTLERGHAMFVQQCAPCHGLAQEGFGPPLGGVTALFTETELLERIRDSSKVLAAGDTRIATLVRRYKTIMPPFSHVPDADLRAILAYIDQQSAAQKLTALSIDSAKTPATFPRWSPPVQSSPIVIELEDVAQIPRLPGRTPYKGITLLRPDLREPGVLLVDELMGLLYRVKDRAVSVFLDVRETFPEFLCDPGVASGLGSFALHPLFAHNGLFYTLHSEKFRGSAAVNASDIPVDVPKYETPPLEWVVTEWRLSALAAVSFVGTHREVLRFVTPTTGHAGQEISFSPVTNRQDPNYAKLFIAIGDGGSGNLRRPDMAGHPRTFLGAILRIDPSGRNGTNGQYGIPPDNPFAQSDDPMVRKEIWAYGFRNPHRISWDLADTKRMICVDIGEANVEEVNIVEKGGAYGWGAREVEGRTRIDIKADLKVVHPASPAELAGVRLPFGEYDHVEGAAITGGYVYRGPLELLRGKYIFGDIVNGRLFYMNMGPELTDRTVYELSVAHAGVATSIKTLAKADRAHLRFGYDERTGDLFILTKDDGMIRKIVAAVTK